ncbi:MAG: hypothetical protein K2X34_00435 [Hyphomonadaceae bacterium]|nr:hypothetical protein [Hyphomonadaceae bacterium]
MIRLILLLLIVAGVAGYFTKPDEAAMRAGADAVLSDPGNISEGVEGVAVTLAGDRAYTNYYVAAKYDVTLDGQPVVNCWGAFTQVQCTRAEDTRTGG